MVMIRLYVLLIFVFSLVAMHPAVHRRSRARTFVELQCRATRYPELCIRCLSNLITNSNATQLSHQQLAQIALRVSLVQLNRLGFTSPKWPNNSRNQRPRIINKSKMVNEDSESKFPMHANNVQTWMSAAVTDARWCLNGFSGRSIGGMTKAMIKAKVLNLVQVNSNALALFNRFAARYRASHVTKPKV